MANIVQAGIRPEAETRARLGMPVRAIRRRSRSRSSRTTAYDLGGMPGRRWRQRPVPPAAWQRSHAGPPVARRSSPGAVPRPPGVRAGTLATRPAPAPVLRK